LYADLRAKGGASDLVQQRFLEAQHDFDRFDGTTEKQLHAWLKQILRNNVRNFRRDFRHVGKRQIGKEVPLNSRGPGRDLADGLAAKGPTPSGHAVAKEQAEMLTRVLNRLPENYRRAIELHHREQLTFEVVGQRLGCSVEAA